MGAYTKFGKTEISAGFFLVLAVMMYLDTECLILMFIFAAILHELAHIVTIKLFGGSIRRLRLKSIGAEIEYDYPCIFSNVMSLLIYISGPVVNLLVAIVSSHISSFISLPELYTFAGVNLILGLFNLLPVKKLDGGEVLLALSYMVFAKEILLVDILHYITIIFLFAICVISALKSGFNLTLLFVVIWMITGLFREHNVKLAGL